MIKYNNLISNNVSTAEIEIALSEFFKCNKNIVIPNLSYGFGRGRKNCYEKDLVVIYPSGKVYEIEIKVSKADLKADTHKGHTHDANFISQLYFAIPQKLFDEKGVIALIPEKAGILVISKKWFTNVYGDNLNIMYYDVNMYRKAQINSKANVLSKEEQYKMMKLAYLRVWSNKKKVLKLNEQISELKNLLKKQK
jgi:hypothetical protein